MPNADKKLDATQSAENVTVKPMKAAPTVAVDAAAKDDHRRHENATVNQSKWVLVY